MVPVLNLSGSSFPRGIKDPLIGMHNTTPDKLRKAPTEYIEGKPQRAVTLDEFSGAAVPENTPPEIMKMLEDAGLRIEKYAKPEDRAKAIKRFKELLFGAGAVGLGLDQYEQQMMGGM